MKRVVIKLGSSVVADETASCAWTRSRASATPLAELHRRAAR